MAAVPFPVMRCLWHILILLTSNYATCGKETLTTEFASSSSPNDTSNANWDKPREEEIAKVKSQIVILKASSMMTYKIGMGIQTYLLPVIVLVGLVGNSLSFLVMLQRHNRRISCCVYMATLSVTDNVMLLIGAHYWVTSSIRTAGNGHFECVVLLYIVMATSLTGVILIILMTVDRCIAVKFPFKAMKWCSTKRAKISIILVFIFTFVYSIPYILFSKPLNNGKICGALSIPSKFTRIYSYVSVILNAVIPFFTLTFLNTIIIVTIHNRKSFFQKDKQEDTGQTKKNHDPDNIIKKEESSGDRQLTVMLLLVSFALLGLTLPQYIRSMVYSFVDYSSNPESYALYVLMNNITSKLFFANNASNFFLYAIGGSKFRADLANMFRCFRKKLVDNKGSMSSMSTVVTQTNTITEG